MSDAPISVESDLAPNLAFKEGAPKKNKWNILAWIRTFFIAVLCLGLGGAGYWGWQTVRNAQAQLDQNQYDIQQVRRQLDDQSEPLTQLLDQVNGMKKSSEEQQISQRLLEEQQQDTHSKLEDLAERFNQFTITEKTDWLIAEIESLLKLADQHLELSYDVGSAMRLLDRSAELSQSINEVGALEVRQAMLNDKHLLASVGQVDVEGIFLELGALADQVPRLGVPTQLAHNIAAQNLLVVPQASVAAGAPNWQARLSNMWTQLMTLFSQHLVRVRKLDEPIKPLLPPDQRMYLDQNLILLLEQAQLAALRHEGRNYSLSLAQAQHWVERYFDAGQSATQNMLVTLKKLQAINIHPVVPKLNASMNALESFKRVWLDTKKQRQLQSERMRVNQQKTAPSLDGVAQ